MHAIAHQLGAKYHIAHGLANAVLLDIVLEEYGDIVTIKLAEIADYCGFETINNKNNEEKAEFLLNHIRALKKRFEIPASISEIKESDLQDLAIQASKEAHPDYPVPEFWQLEKFKSVLNQAMYRSNQ